MATILLRRALISAALVAAFAHAAYAQSMVRGTIVDERKQPLEGVLIAFDAIDFANQREAKTDKRGQFLFQGLDSGDYRIAITKDGYETVKMTRTVSRTNRLDVNLTLRSLVSLRRAAEVIKKAADLSAGTQAAPSASSGAAVAAAARSEPQASTISATHYSQGVVLWNSGKYAEARAQFEASVKADPQNAPALYQLGIAHLNLGQLREARTAFEAYLEVAPDGPHASEVRTVLQQLPKESKP